MGIPETIQHLTLDCPSFDAHRRLLWCPAVVPSCSTSVLWARTLRLSADIKLSTFLAALNSHYSSHFHHPLFFEPKHVFPGDFFNLSPDEQRCDVRSNISSLIADLRSLGELD